MNVTKASLILEHVVAKVKLAVHITAVISAHDELAYIPVTRHGNCQF